MMAELLNRFRQRLFLVFLPLFAVGFVTAADETGARNDKDSAIDAARGVLRRLIPAHVDSFEFVRISPDANGHDIFEIESRDGKIVLRGNNGVSLCSALNWYLKYFCHANISWSGVQIELPDRLPEVPEKIQRTSLFKYRYFFNYCCFGYSMPWWDWDQWEFMIDWMALNGVNMPLAVTGQEAVWQALLQGFGLNDEAIRGFLAGPPYLPFGWMGCLDGWGGPLSQDWIDRHAELQKKILARERELGMTPVLQGFTGHVPAAIREKFPDVTLHRIKWIEWNTVFIDPLDPLFARFGKAFIEQQTRMFGTDHLYAADTFIEMSPPSNNPEFLKTMGKSLFNTMTSADPEAVWVMQGWIFYNNAQFWQPAQAKAFLGGVPNHRMILLDLFCDVSPVWNKTESFYGKPWIWCILQNFGNTVSLSGPLPRINEELHRAATHPERGNLSGIGMIQEGLDYNPVVFEFMTERIWRDYQPVDLNKWMADYAIRRYGRPSHSTQKAWTLLQKSVYNDTHSPNSVVTKRPSYDADESLDSPTLSNELTAAWDQLLACGVDIKQTDTYCFDLINVTRQVLSNIALKFYLRVMTDYRGKNVESFRLASKSFLELLRDLDRALATRTEFLLGKWIEDAKRWGNSEEERRLYEWNARNVITLWGGAESSLHDYARKEWSGLVAGFYLHRWQRFFECLEQSLAEEKSFNNDAFTLEIKKWEESWTHQSDPYPSQPVGNAVEVAIQLREKYKNELK